MLPARTPAGARTLPGSFEPPAGVDPAQRVLSGLAQAPYRHRVSLQIQGTAEQIRARLPASVATLEESVSRASARSRCSNPANVIAGSATTGVPPLMPCPADSQHPAEQSLDMQYADRPPPPSATINAARQPIPR